MTREEKESCICTINTLRRLALNIHGVIDVVDDANCSKLIELLKQEPCEDYVSREDVITIIAKKHMFKDKSDFDKCVHLIAKQVKSLPPVTPTSSKMEQVEQEPCEDWHDVPSDEMTLGQARQAVRDLRKFIMDDHILSKLQPCEENMEDLISRKAVLNLTKELRFNSVKGMEDYCYRCIDPNEVEELPPIQPKAKVGHWIKVAESYLPYMCSECGKSEFRKSNYCPNCGAEMQEVEK